MSARRGPGWLPMGVVGVALAAVGGPTALLIIWMQGGFDSTTSDRGVSEAEKRPDGVPDLAGLRRYPYESLVGRLEYEDDHNSVEETKLPAPALQRLANVENYEPWKGGRGWRQEVLVALHSNKVEAFIGRPNNGLARMPEATAVELLELPEESRVPFAHVPGSAPSTEDVRVNLAATGRGPQPTLETLDDLHMIGRYYFLDPFNFGHVKDRDHVAGFRSHQFNDMPELRLTADKSATPTERWALVRLELVSLLKHERPAVYVSDHLPRMDDLKKSATRPLSEFEDHALKAIRDGEDLVTEATTNRILMVGTLRATKQCLDCHSARRGDLLGAFSYELQRDPQWGSNAESVLEAPKG